MKRLACLAVALTTGACAQQPLLVPVIAPVAPVNVPAMQPLALDPVQWQVLPASKANPAPLFALDEANYKNLNLNLAEIRRFLDEQKAVIAMLKTINDQRAAAPTSIPQSTSKSP